MASPKHYYEGCIFDSFTGPDSSLACASLQAYAALCAQKGICVDWRSRTGGACRECLPAPSRALPGAVPGARLGWGDRPPEERPCSAPGGLGPLLLARNSMGG